MRRDVIEQHVTLLRVTMRKAEEYRWREYPAFVRDALDELLQFVNAPIPTARVGGMKTATVVNALMREARMEALPAHDAPQTWEALCAWRTANPSVRTVPVFDGGCYRSVYPSPSDNHAFRAWHDLLHLRLDADFSPGGEAFVFFASLIEVSIALPIVSRGTDVLWTLWGDHIGQGFYHGVHGQFPVDQRGFVEAFLENPGTALTKEW
jgi:hypothetical protein